MSGWTPGRAGPRTSPGNRIAGSRCPRSGFAIRSSTVAPNMFERRLDRLEAWDPEFFGEGTWCDEEAEAYFTELRDDPGRIAVLREAFAARVDRERDEAAMRSAFEDRLTIHWERAFEEDGSFSPLVRILTEYVSGLQNAR